jgi:hypothetical protein
VGYDVWNVAAEGARSQAERAQTDRLSWEGGAVRTPQPSSRPTPALQINDKLTKGHYCFMNDFSLDLMVAVVESCPGTFGLEIGGHSVFH